MFPSGPPPNPPTPEETKAMTQSKYDRRMDENLYWEVEMILEKLLEGLALGQLILSNETAGSLRTKEFEFSDNGEWPWFYNVHTRLRSGSPWRPSSATGTSSTSPISTTSRGSSWPRAWQPVWKFPSKATWPCPAGT